MAIQNQRIRVTKTRPADTTAYAVGDVISESATDTEGTAWTFDAAARSPAGSGYIMKATLDYPTAFTWSPILFLFSVTPTSELDDNAASTAPIAADVDNLVGVIEFDALKDIGTGRSYTVAVPGGGQGLPLKFTCESADDAIYGVLVTNTAFTPGSADGVAIILEIDQL